MELVRPTAVQFLQGCDCARWVYWSFKPTETQDEEDIAPWGRRADCEALEIERATLGASRRYELSIRQTEEQKRVVLGHARDVSMSWLRTEERSATKSCLGGRVECTKLALSSSHASARIVAHAARSRRAQSWSACNGGGNVAACTTLAGISYGTNVCSIHPTGALPAF